MSSTRPTKRARTKASKPSPEDVIEIDRTGDLVMKVGSKTIRTFRVSSKHMTTISKVFAILLGPNFLEGQTTHDAVSPLLLPEDNSSAMELLCKLAHRELTNADDIGAGQLKDLFLLCDKYDCVESFAIYFKVVLARWSRDVERHWLPKLPDGKSVMGLRLLDALCIAFLVQDGPSYERISGMVFNTMTRTQIHGLSSKGLLTLMPDGFQDAMADIWTKRMQRASVMILRPFKAIILDKGRQQPLVVCNESKQEAGALMLNLVHQEYTADEYVFGGTNIISELKSARWTLSNQMTRRKKCSDGKCRYCNHDLRQSFEKAVDAILELKGLCYRCSREGAYDRYAGRCGAKHQK